jgi:hemolysin III
MEGDPGRLIGKSVFGLTLFLLYLFSTIYHGLRGRGKRVFQILDHQSIYLLIAGTYTPLLLVMLEGSPRIWMLTGIWGLAALGILLDAFHRQGRRVIQLLIYVVMGWLCVFAWEGITARLSATAFFLLATGGVLYTSGVVFYLLGKRYPWCHGVWHLFVIGGSVGHFFTILLL